MVKPKKRLGQHFLTDKNIAKKIVESLDQSASNVVEIGPGTGVLSQLLLQKPQFNLLFVEVDNESVEYLKRETPQIEEKIIHADFLRLDSSFFPDKFNIIGNFPYNISSQIFFKILEFKDHVSEVVCMVQKEVAQRITAPPGNKTYGILTVLLSAFYKTEYLFTVPPSVFKPPPKVQSAVIKLKRNKIDKLDCNEMLFFKVVKSAFNQRRKMLRNSLYEPGLILPEKYADKRAEQLTVEDFIIITNIVDSFRKSL